MPGDDSLRTILNYIKDNQDNLSNRMDRFSDKINGEISDIKKEISQLNSTIACTYSEFTQHIKNLKEESDEFKSKVADFDNWKNGSDSNTGINTRMTIIENKQKNLTQSISKWGTLIVTSVTGLLMTIVGYLATQIFDLF
ncbi:MAG: hypothetical protein BAJALOKI3v1_50047 [Promethearchaeota archaeon]|nr:MAG: hypothetical protein BAJALOKI3v1_50047 [Candidatus Lokiarchaeota archaeon]